MRRVALVAAGASAARRRSGFLDVLPETPEPPYRVELLGRAANASLSLCATLDWWPAAVYT